MTRFGIVKYDVPTEATVLLRIHDLSGKAVRTLVNEHQRPGRYNTTLGAEGLPAGVYFARFATDNYHKETKKLILLRQ